MRHFLAVFLLSLPVFGQNCAPADPLRLSDSVNGTLGEGNCRLSDGSAYAEYRLVVPVRGRVELNATGEALVLLSDLSGAAFGFGASVAQNVEKGAYSVRVSGKGGAYTLTSAFTPEPGLLCGAFPSIGLNQSVAGSLSAASCRLPDQSAYDAYDLFSLGAGTLTIGIEAAGFTPQILLRDTDGHLLASDAAQITYTIGADSAYRILAASTGSDTGKYTLKVSFTPCDAESCRPQKSFAGSDQHQGTITAKSCTAKFGDTDFYYNYYEIQVAEPGAVELRASAGGFLPELVLLDPSGSTLADDFSGGGKGLAIVRQYLKPGTYIAQVYSASATAGDYTFQYGFQASLPEICPVLTLDPGGSANGTLNAASTCRVNGRLGDVYRIVLPSAGTLDVLLSSGDFDAVLTLRDANDAKLASDDDLGGGTDARIVADLPAGTYTLVASNYDVTGGYTVRTAFQARDLPACPAPQSLALNGAYIGVLGLGPCRASNGQPVDYYQFTTPSDGTIAAFMTSQAVDSYLGLVDAQGNVIRRDDNTYGQGDAMMIQFLPAGTYRLAARASQMTAGGRYRVDLLFASGSRPAGCAPLRNVGRGDTVAATTNYTSCDFPDQTFADIYELDLAGTDPVDIKLTSGNFDAYLIVLDSRGNVVAEDDDSAGNTDARVNRPFDPGTYYIVAKPFSDYTSIGDYRLSVN